MDFCAAITAQGGDGDGKYRFWLQKLITNALTNRLQVQRARTRGMFKNIPQLSFELNERSLNQSIILLLPPPGIIPQLSSLQSTSAR